VNQALVSLGSCGIAAGGLKVWETLEQVLGGLGVRVHTGITGCTGLCYREPILRLVSEELGDCLYGDVTAEVLPGLLEAHFLERRSPPELLLAGPTSTPEAAFLQSQHRIVLRNCGHIDPESLDHYLAAGGYEALRQALTEMTPEQVVQTVEASGLRGRGGGGFSTGRKWALARRSPERDRVMICNADEGDPGAFMDRNVLEGDPFSVLEGMTLAAYAIGARSGFVYVREEYPLAVQRLHRAVHQARGRGLLGDRILDSDFSFEVQIKRGAGAFVCGEETALIASLEGRRGTPRRRPPFPVESGLWGRPTVINNVETLANVPYVVQHGASSLHLGDGDHDRGTKVFSLAGDVARTGMVEVPMGMTLRQVVEEIGGGSSTSRPLKAVQIGGPSGGCLPASLFDTPVDYQSLGQTGAIMGSGGMIAMDSTRCMVDVARYFQAFTQEESCGKCTFCRLGTKRMLEILERICAGTGRPGDLEKLEVLAEQVRSNSLCGLGRSAPNPVLTTLRYFREEYEAHLEGRCPAGRCRNLVEFRIDPFICEGCASCRAECSVAAIAIDPLAVPLSIDASVCVRCGGCFEICSFSAVAVQ